MIGRSAHSIKEIKWWRKEENSGRAARRAAEAGARTRAAAQAELVGHEPRQSRALLRRSRYRFSSAPVSAAVCKLGTTLISVSPLGASIGDSFNARVTGPAISIRSTSAPRSRRAFSRVPESASIESRYRNVHQLEPGIEFRSTRQCHYFSRQTTSRAFESSAGSAEMRVIAEILLRQCPCVA